tara:strand:- start:1090 stop:1719 length:630 start_codon:yes stop_codon:yes gene_type:complete
MANAPKLRTISNFKTALAGGAARPNLFEVSIPNLPATFQGAAWDDETFRFMAKAAALPASNIAQIEIPFRGRTLKVAGDRTFDVWTVTIINDENFKLRTAFELWMNGISKLDNNTGSTNPTAYMCDAYVHQLGRGDKKESTSNYEAAGAQGETGVTPLRTYKFYDIFPTNVSQIDLSYDTSDTIEEFTVDFQVQYWEAGEGDQNGVRVK